jgi:2-(1,2-epoxy-1,2-dihydrophenyl)acetyl-CoA isomerase
MRAEPPDAPILVQVAEAVGTITLNRPRVLNALDLDMARAFLSALADLRDRDEVRVIVLRGSGKAFSAGGDVNEMLNDVRVGKDRAAYFRAPLRAFGEMVMAVRAVPKPVVAAVHGAVAGVAFNLMLACDLRIASESTRFTQAFVGIGLSPDGGGTWFLPRIVGHARACEMTMLPTTLDARTAKEWGLINQVAPDEQFERALTDLASRLAEGPTSAMGRAKALLRAAYDRDLASHIEAERLAQVENADSFDFEEGLAAFAEKRPARFIGR